MSKIDRQLDEIVGEERVRIDWPRGESVDADRVRNRIRYEIDCHERRIPLDLRGVHGAPQALVEILVESQQYARSKGKLLSISAAKPAMTEALQGTRPRPKQDDGQAVAEKESVDASKIAKGILDSRRPSESNPKIDLSKSERIVRKPAQRGSSKFRRYATMLAVVAVATSAIAAVECYFLFGEEPSVTVPKKTYESQD